MVDIHAHILYGVDDGPATIEESINILYQAVKEGITDIIVTPHGSHPQFDVKKEVVEERYKSIKEAVETLGQYLTSLSNRDYTKFDEKYVKLIFYSICKALGAVYVKTELEIEGKYADILIMPREK